MSGAQFGPLWSELSVKLSQKSLDVLDKLGFERAAPVQATVIPLLCTNKDVAVEACTGSGKTLAFVLPLVEILLKAEADQAYKKHEVGAVVVSPTRELARQIFDIAVPFIENLPGPGATLLVGGSDSTADVARFSETGSRVLIGTPGRLNDVMTRSKVMVLKRVELLILDEADRLLSMGFALAVTSIIGRLPKQRRTGLFSATQTEEVEELARAGLRNPVKVKVRDLKSGGKKGDAAAPGGKTPNQLRLLYTVVEQRDKVAHLLRFLQLHRAQKTIVYFLTCASVDFFAEVLASAPQTKDLALTALHGRMKQSAREKAMEAFSQRAEGGVLLATDVAARGLDIPGVEWILQYDPPQDPDSFVHRVGRTARMGSSGSSLAFLLPTEETYVEFLKLRQVALELAPPVEGAQAGPEVTAALRRRAETEREVAEKGARAFVSFVRGYKEHQCQFIFRLKELPLGHLAASFGVLRMPKMREVKRKVDYEGFTPSTVAMDDVPYKDKAREKQRQKNLREAAAAAAAAPAEDEEELQRQEKKRKREEAAAAAAAAAPKPTAAKRRLAQRREEDDELDEDWKLLKKLKKGKISEHQYNVALGFSDDEEDGGAGGARGKSGGGASSSGGGSDDDDSGDDEAAAPARSAKGDGNGRGKGKGAGGSGGGSRNGSANGGSNRRQHHGYQGGGRGGRGGAAFRGGGGRGGSSRGRGRHGR